MRMRALMTTALFLLAAATAFAQAPGGARVGLAAGLKQAYAFAKTNVTQSAEKMPEADYAFKPTPDIRSFGALWAHVANAHYFICSSAKGVPNPNQGQNLEQTKTSKADIVKALADSFAFCDDAFSALTDESAGQFVNSGRGGEQARAAVLTNLIAHDNEMYGIGTVYLRLKGLVPPSTEAQGQRGGGRRGQ
jgi:uncharacterized damage-inducible protein DinB